LVWLALWPVVTVAWLVAVPFILLYVSVAFIIEAFFETCLPRTENSAGTEPPRRGFGEGPAIPAKGPWGWCISASRLPFSKTPRGTGMIGRTGE